MKVMKVVLISINAVVMNLTSLSNAAGIDINNNKGQGQLQNLLQHERQA